jgi:deoxyribodipyrimidine photo-lyase
MSTFYSPPTAPAFDQGLVWLRRDLRCDDHAALHHALRACRRVWVVFVFDTDILQPLLDRGLTSDRRVEFIHHSLAELDTQLQELGAAAGTPDVRLLVAHGTPLDRIPALAQALHVQAVFANHDDEPQSLQRDAQVLGALAHAGVVFKTYKDHVIFERLEVLTQAGQPFGVFTPFKNAWLKRLSAEDMAPLPVRPHAAHLAPLPHTLPPTLAAPLPTLQSLGFKATNLITLALPTGSSGGHRLLADFVERMDRYYEARDFPAVKGPSYLSTHLRFGTVSVRELVRLAWPRYLDGQAGASTWLSELIWRDFYHQIMANHPHVVQRAFKPEYDRITFEKGAHAKALYAAWCEGRTGYPLVDAAMAQINQTGYMHNRLRMVVASFLVKDLGLHWGWGERYFADHLIDFDLAANNGGWQWAASSGCDAQPYFRIFNPVSQSEKFDSAGKFIRRYVPALAALPDKAIHAPWQHPILLADAGIVLGRDYPAPVVDHAVAREITLQRYAVVKKA